MTDKFRVIEGGGASPLGGGGGPEDPMIEARVGRLEDDLKDVKTELKELRRDVASVKETLARIDGRLSAMPTTFQLLLGMLATWGAGAGIAFAMLRLSGQ